MIGLDSPPPFAVCIFDCDSTLSAIEGIDELADDDARVEIAELTRRAMAGELALDKVYAARLARIAPTREAVARIANLYETHAVRNARSTIALLRSLGKQVAVVSGGLLGAVRPFAVSLGVDPDLVFAVDLEFERDGTYRDFDRNSPLVRDDGKPEIVRQLTARFGPACLIGDGTTDLATRGVAARFIGFCGFETRARVIAEADHIIREPNLAPVLQLVLTDEERSFAGI